MAAPLLAGGPQPSGGCPLAGPVAPRDLGLAPLAPLVGVKRPLAQVGGVGSRHRSSPVGLKAISTADSGAGSVDGYAIRSSLPGLLLTPARLQDLTPNPWEPQDHARVAGRDRVLEHVEGERLEAGE